MTKGLINRVGLFLPSEPVVAISPGFSLFPRVLDASVEKSPADVERASIAIDAGREIIKRRS